METEKMMVRLLAEIKAEIRSNKAKTEMENESQPRTPETRNVAKMETNQEMMEAQKGKMMAKMDSRLEKMEFCLEKRRPRKK
jgi:hypothetical protein